MARVCHNASIAWFFLIQMEGVNQDLKKACTLAHTCSCADCLGVQAFWQLNIFQKLVSEAFQLRLRGTIEEVIPRMKSLGANITSH